jgi:formylglycine-generating enzyme required for sulfatase activity
MPLAVLLLLWAPTGTAEEATSTPEREALALVSSDVRTSWNAARALLDRPGSESKHVRKALASLVKEGGFAVDVPRILRTENRGGFIDRIRRAALLARLKADEIAVPEGMVAVPGGLAIRPLTGEEILVENFLIDRCEVSRQDYARFMAKVEYRPPGEGFLSGWSKSTPPAGTGARAVTDVSRADAAVFAKWRKARLPTAEEWAIARGGCARRKYPWGRAPKKGLANVFDGRGSGLPEKIEGRLEGATALGLLRLAGNVTEWTSSPWGPVKGMGVCAGESFLTVPGFGQTLLRKTKVKTRRRDLGFRCAATITKR